MSNNGGAAVRRLSIAAAVLAAATTLIAGGQHDQPVHTTETKTAVQAFKNIQVLKDIPADQLIPSMQFITNALGVECDFCHVEGAFDKDDKDEKKTARKMMAMVITINQDNFEGKKMVSCNTCHRGSLHPQGIPEITAEARKPVDTEEMEKEHHEHHADFGPPDAVLDAYAKAVHLDKMTQLKSISESASMAMGPGGVQVEIFEERPDRRISVAHMPGGKDSVTAYNGSEGWLSFPGRPLRLMNADERYAAKLDAEFLVPSDPRKAFAEIKSASPDTINGKPVNVLLGLNPGQPPVKLYFDKDSGLLVRMVRYADTPLGNNPTQVDFADYHVEDEMNLPHEWTIARPFSRFTMKVSSVKLNAEIPKEKWEKPAGPAH